MTVELINHPSANPDGLCGEAAAMCYDGDDFEKSYTAALAHGHESVSEHATYTFKVCGASVVLLKQLTRHRIASYSVRSQRYCGVTPDWVTPKSIQGNPDAERGYHVALHMAFEAYLGLLERGIKPEDARYVIPQGVRCNFIFTMNTRELRHFFELRLCSRAQDEIRELAAKMLDLVQPLAPISFAGCGPACVNGACREGKRGNPGCKNPWNANTGRPMEANNA